MRHRLDRCRRSGLTLVEIVIVISILSLLGVFVIVNTGRGKAHSRLAACAGNLKSIATALSMYANDDNGRYPTTLTSLTPGYLRSIPKCPAVPERNDTYIAGYQGAREPARYTLVCKSSASTTANHATAGEAVDFPQWTSSSGRALFSVDRSRF